MTKKLVFVGNIVSSNASMELNCFNGYVEVVNGSITAIGTKQEFQKQVEQYQSSTIINLGPNEFLMPGFVDCHTHAPQFPNIGLGLDRPLLEWLDKYTFPLEKKYSDVDFASHVYDIVVKRVLNNGTTTACYFGSLHLEGTLELVKSVITHHQRALVGKVSMNMKNDVGYYNSTKKELQEVETFVNKVQHYKNDLVHPIITPRFAVSCDEELMKGLSEIAEKYNCGIQILCPKPIPTISPTFKIHIRIKTIDSITTFTFRVYLRKTIKSYLKNGLMRLCTPDLDSVLVTDQSHISENKQEIEYVLKLYPECSTYTDVYERCGIFNPRCIMAHAVYLSDDEMGTFSRRGVSVAHCPASNTRLLSGLCPVRKLLQKQVCVGLGTDISGGDNSSILDAMRRAMDVSIHSAMLDKTYIALDWKEVFYLATLGGAKALGLSDKIGNFEVGRCFDALLVDVYSEGGPIDKYEHSTGGDAILELVQRFVYLGDDRNIRQVYVQGKLVKDTSD